MPPVIPSNIFLYKPDAELPDLTNYLNQTIEVKIEKRYITRDNPNVIKRKFWGSETYTSNSDMVCVLLHFGKFSIEELNNKFRDGVNLFLSVGKGTISLTQPREPTTQLTKMGSSLENTTTSTNSQATL